MDFVIESGGALHGNIKVPGDKSISHRAVILSAVANGVSRIFGLLCSEDVMATIGALRQMGVSIRDAADNSLIVDGAGSRGLIAPDSVLDLGNSGTAIRLLAGLLAGQQINATLTGDESLCKRPMRRIEGPLNQMGAQVRTSPGGTPPIEISSSGQLKGTTIRLPVASAQVKSALLLAGMYASGETCIEEPNVTRDHTERMMATFGYPCKLEQNRICVTGGGELYGSDIEIPGDLSSAAFFIVGAAISPGSKLKITGVGINPTRTGILTILEKMGARIVLERHRNMGKEPVADILVEYAPLKGIEIPPYLVSLAIDEFPIIAVSAACADGDTIVRGAEELRHKESDRIHAIVAGLKNIGVQAEEYADGMIIRPGAMTGGTVSSFGDHRVAMAFSMAALSASKPITVTDCDNIATSFPSFFESARTAGLGIRQV